MQAYGLLPEIRSGSGPPRRTKADPHRPSPAHPSDVVRSGPAAAPSAAKPPAKLPPTGAGPGSSASAGSGVGARDPANTPYQAKEAQEVSGDLEEAEVAEDGGPSGVAEEGSNES